jgi:tRNA (mo5U34)-methyltransferase
MKIETKLPAAEVAEQLRQLGPWFYPFEFQTGAKAEPLDQSALVIHQSRAAGIFPVLDQHFKGRWANVSCLDIACHEGWFSLQIAQRGARKVRGIDIRPERIEKANFLRNAGGFSAANFEVGDFFNLNPEQDGIFDLTFFLGIFYHLEDPVRGFRKVRALTREVCVIEGQVARHQGKLTTAWGRKEDLRSGAACVVIDADPNHIAPGAAVCVVPSLDALKQIIRAAGFSRTEVVQPKPGMHEQFLSFDRVMLFAFI